MFFLKRKGFDHNLSNKARELSGTCSQPPDKPNLVRYARKLDPKSSPFGRLTSSKEGASRHKPT